MSYNSNTLLDSVTPGTLFTSHSIRQAFFKNLFIYLFIFKINLFIYLFSFGCVGSSFLCEGFL